jgi:ferredoxin
MNEKLITMDEEKCKKCGLCARVCPMRIYTQKKDEYPVIKDMQNCVLCGQCIAVCPHDAITHNMLPSDRFIRISDPHPVREEELFAALRQRRSVRAFQKKDVPRDELYEIAQCCGYCPTGAHGSDGWKRNVIIVTGKENMQQVLEYTVDYMKILKRKLNGFMVKLVSRWVPEARGGLSTLPEISLRLELYKQGQDAILYNAPALILIHTPNDTPTPQADCDAALYAMMLAAQSKGLGTCWMGWVQYAASGFKVRSFSKLKEFFKVPASHDVYSAMVLGYPAIKLHSVPYRVTQCTWID